jgi:2-keto-4-pentenoate hydratase/2-oxohepta-3-ene-1,7-dioic acid hydratase in catechol pathway
MLLLSGALWTSPFELRDADPSPLLAPVVPSKVLCVGRNYAAHAKEMGSDVPREPLLFLKPPSSIVGPDAAIVLPKISERVEHEAELAVVIGTRAKNVSAENARAHVFGYACANDVTARDLQRRDGQWSRAKGFDTFCPIGPWIETEIDPSNLRVVCRVGSEVRQDARTSSMIFDVDKLIAAMSAVMTLEPGDVILTGTPEGVSPIKSGDRVEVEIEGIGLLASRVS